MKPFATLRAAIACLLLATIAPAAFAQTISQPVEGSTIQANNSLGQSFTATLTGFVTAIDVRSLNTMTATLYLYNGSSASGVLGSAGIPAYTQTGVAVTQVPTGGAWSHIVLSTPFAVVAGNSYTFVLTNPGLWGSTNDPYAGGSMVSDYATVWNSTPFSIDLGFQIYEITELADLSITMTDGVTTATAGGSTTYTITASNAGPYATSATVADTFPAALTTTWTCVGAGGGTCPAAGAGNINNTVNLPAGGSVTYTVSAAISAAATGTLSNTATITAPVAAHETNLSNNSASDTDTIVRSANLAITKTDGVTTANPGGSVTYTITASNAGPSNAPGATVADTFPAALTGTWTCVGAGGGTCTASGAGNINDTVNLPAGGSVTYTVSAAINAAATGALSNTATVAGPGGVTDPALGNNSANDTDTLVPQANLAITKTDGVTTATPGGSVTYTITASNAGPSNALGATVADTLPASLTATWTCLGAGGGTCTAAGTGNINDTVNLPAGGSVTYTVSAAISAAATGTLANTATITAPGGVTDPALNNNSATDTDTLAPQADLAITKTNGVTTSSPGGSVTYTITASNAGPSNVTGATVADTFPATLTGTWTCVGAGGGTCTASGAGNINDTVNLPAGGSVTYTVSATISAAATGTLSNTATITAPGGVTDPALNNNSATDTDTLAFGPPVTFSGPSATGTGTITVTMTGGAIGCAFVAPAFVATPAGSSAKFPHGMFTFSTASCGVGTTLTFAITYPQPLPPTTRYYKFARTLADPTNHWYTLPVTVAGNTATFQITDGGMGDDDLAMNGAVVDPGGPGFPGGESVPTTNPLALLMLVLMMLGGAVWMARRRGS